MGYKGRDTKQSIKRGMSKGKGYPKGEMGFSLFIDKDNKIIFRKSGYFVCTPFIVCPPPPPPPLPPLKMWEWAKTLVFINKLSMNFAAIMFFTKKDFHLEFRMHIFFLSAF